LSRALSWSATDGIDGTQAPAESTPVDPALRLQHALEDAYRYLARRDRTVSEVRGQLEKRGIEPDTIEQALAELGEQNYLDDARYARAFAEDRRALDGWGPDRIARKLAQVGVDGAHVEAALSTRGAEDELEAAVELLRRKLRTPPEDDRARERALGLLVRRGYALELAYDAIRAFSREG
jgi:regulatory protein